jgi:hypothetical protein
MAAHRQYTALGWLALATSLFLWSLAASCVFVPAGSSKNLRSPAQVPSDLQFESVSQSQASASEEPSTQSWTPRATALAAIVGLVAGLAPLTSVRAEEATQAAVAPAAPVASLKEATKKEQETDETKRLSAPSKEERVKRALAQVKAEEKNLDDDFALKRGEQSRTYGEALKTNTKRTPVKEDKPKSEGGGFSFSLPSFSVPEQPAPGAKKVIISPADDLDEDELPMTRPNPFLLFLGFALPTSIYLAFYIAGSLNII